MKTTLKRTALALAVVSLAAAGTAQAQEVVDYQEYVTIDHDITVDDTRNYETNVIDNRDYDVTVDDTRNFETNTTNTTYDQNVDINATVDADVDLVLDAAAVIRYNSTTNELSNSTENYTSDETRSLDYTSDETRTVNYTDDTIRYDEERRFDSESSTRVDNSWNNVVTEDVDVDSEIRREQNEHGRSVYLSKDLSLDSDISFTGDIALTGDLDVDSAAIAVVDGRQTILANEGNNDMLANEASIDDDAASGSSGNLGFNVAAGDNNAQDNAAALSAADAAFSFGMSDAEIFNNQIGANNQTENSGVTNDASMGGNAFNGATGNIAVNIAAGNNNAQRNALAASVSVAGYAQASVASDQVSTGNVTNNTGMTETVEGTTQFNLTGTVSGNADSSAGYEGRGASYQMTNIYPELWGADENDGNHNSSPRLGHVDMDGDMQGSVDNPYRGEDEFGEIGGIAFDSDESGIIDLSETELDASLSGSGTFLYDVDVQATNTASLNGSAFSGASGNIGVNIASGTGNLQSNSLSLAVAQPGNGNGGGGGGGGGGGAGPGG